ncbi:hypothetical protein NM688_g5610 [Phlebia brevispora]|uniref:Uncharacterized protein n=1 Tax=Phlebia brevispora TaxID=194682 RepID=A0ACC1SSM5_9APHY|nr:hypothetical protein NM688_g5610 [Phlebia brevispora]
MVNITIPVAAAAAFASQTYDFVIVGGGTAGLTVASRQNYPVSFVLIAVIEAGIDRSHDPNVTMAGNWPTVYTNPTYTWNFSTVAQTQLGGLVISQPRGKLLGGSSGINAMEWRIASKDEYDAWAALGNPGWDFKGLQAFFKQAENFTVQSGNPLFPASGALTSDKGTHGPIIVSLNLWYSTLISKFLDAVQKLGFVVNADPDGGVDAGASNIARSVNNADGTRQYSAVTYLRLAQNRPNLHVLTGAQVTKIIFETNPGANIVAKGVQFVVSGQTYSVSVSEEVILSAGAFQTPQILELSGIGKTSVLGQFEIRTLVDLPVGENLMDHALESITFALTTDAQQSASLFSVPANLVVTNGTSPSASMTGTPMLWAPMASVAHGSDLQVLVNSIQSTIAQGDVTPLEAAQFAIQKTWLTQKNPSVPEVQIIFPSLPGSPGLPLPDGSLGVWMPSSHVHPLSRGSVHLVSSDPLVPPAINPNYLSREYDTLVWLQILNFTSTISVTGELGAAVSGPIAPPPGTTSVAAMTSWIKENVGTQFHPAGTAAMAPKVLGGVVDPQLKVYGTANVRVIDASIFPMTVGATLQATVYAVAEKGAAIIKAIYRL